MRISDSPADEPRSPAGATPTLADLLLGELVEQPGTRVRAAREIQQPGARPQLLRGSAAAPMPPTVGSRGRHAEGGSCRLLRHPLERPGRLSAVHKVRGQLS